MSRRRNTDTQSGSSGGTERWRGTSPGAVIPCGSPVGYDRISVLTVGPRGESPRGAYLGLGMQASLLCSLIRSAVQRRAAPSGAPRLRAVTSSLQSPASASEVGKKMSVSMPSFPSFPFRHLLDSVAGAQLCVRTYIGYVCHNPPVVARSVSSSPDVLHRGKQNLRGNSLSAAFNPEAPRVFKPRRHSDDENAQAGVTGSR